MPDALLSETSTVEFADEYVNIVYYFATVLNIEADDSSDNLRQALATLMDFTCNLSHRAPLLQHCSYNKQQEVSQRTPCRMTSIFSGWAWRVQVDLLLSNILACNSLQIDGTCNQSSQRRGVIFLYGSTRTLAITDNGK